MVGLVGGWGLIRLHNRVADDAAGSPDRIRRGALEVAARDKARQRDHVGDCQRQDALPQRPIAGTLAHG
jgi:hypothetical protein